jgi:hypothetical protein
LEGSNQRLITFRVSYPYHRENVVVIVLGSYPGDQLWGFVEPFDITLWVAIIASFLIVPMIVFLMDAQHRGKQVNPDLKGQCFLVATQSKK